MPRCVCYIIPGRSNHTKTPTFSIQLLKFADKKVMLPGGTKEGLKMLPEFKYATG
jgi:hypothetical protein